MHVFPLLVRTELCHLRLHFIDQVIILTHDQEVTPQLSRHIERSINQTFLVELRSREEGSLVSANKYFEGYDES